VEEVLIEDDVLPSRGILDYARTTGSSSPPRSDLYSEENRMGTRALVGLVVDLGKTVDELVFS